MRRLLLCSFLILTVGILGMVGFGFGGITFIDTFNQLIPFFVETRRAFSAFDGFPTWSWNAFLGDNFFALYGYYTLGNPFSWLVCMFPAGYMGWGMVLALYIKTLLCSASAYMYLRQLKFSDSLCLTGALMYTFSSFYIIGLLYYFFVEPMIFFPLLLMCVEKIFGEGKLRDYLWLAAVTFGAITVNFYFAVSTLGCGVIYFFIRLFYSSERGSRWTIIFRTSMSVMLGVAASCVILLPVLVATLGSPRMGVPTVNDWKFTVLHYLERFYYLCFPRFNDHSDDIFLTFPWHSVSAYVAGPGIVGAIIWTLRRRGHWAAVWFLVLSVIYLTPLAGIFVLFTHPFYLRWGFALILAIITATLFCAVELSSREIKNRKTLSVIFVCIALIGISQPLMKFYFGSLPDSGAEWCAISFNILSFFIAWICVRGGYKVSVMLPSAVAIIAVNFLLFDYFNSFQMGNFHPVRKDFKEFITSHFNGKAEMKVNVMHARTDYKAFCPNQGIFEDEAGYMAYFSNSSHTTADFRELVTSYPETQFVFVVTNRNSLSALLSVNTFKDYGQIPDFIAETEYEELGDSVKSEQGIIYDVPDYIPMGMSYDRYMPKSEFQCLYSDLRTASPGVRYYKMQQRNDSIDLCLQMLANLVVEDADTAEIGKWLKRGAVDPTIRRDSVVEARRAMTAESFTGTRRGFTAEFDSPRDGFYFLSVPNDPGFTLRLDGEPVKAFTVNLGMMGVAVPAGRHTLTGVYTPPGLRAGIIITVLAIIVWMGLWVLASRRQ